jgi:hypothetical protein
MTANVPDREPQSFILKIWIEETAEEAERVKWRGHITHVPSNSRRYVQNLDEIALFLTPYLEQLGVKLKKRRYFSLRLRQREAGGDLAGQRE